MKAFIISLTILLANYSILNFSEQAFTLTCQGTGYFNNERAKITGKKRFQGNYFKFKGEIKTPTFTYKIEYQDYANLVPYEGRVLGSDGYHFVEVIDNSEGKMIISFKNNKIGPPNIIGEFTIRWT